MRPRPLPPEGKVASEGLNLTTNCGVGVGATTVGGGGALVGVGVGFRVGVGLGGGGETTAAAVSTVGTAVGVSVSGCCVGAGELGTVGDVATEPHPITRMAINVKSNGLRRCIPAPPSHSFLRITVKMAKSDR